LLDRQATRELDEIVFATLGAERDKLHVAVQMDFRTLPDVWRRVVGDGTWIQPETAAADPATLYGFFDWAVAPSGCSRIVRSAALWPARLRTTMPRPMWPRR
jgi:hypothetical protein